MAEARVVAGKVDKTILIVRWRQTNRNAARQSLNLLKTFNANLLGVALNMVNLSSRRHHKDPGASNYAYNKYYSMGSKRRLFGFADAKLPPVQENPTTRVSTLKPVNEDVQVVEEEKPKQAV
jgi:Mrp family chromosome partitioning ATPase